MLPALIERGIEVLCLDLDDTLVDTEAGAVLRFSAAVERIRELRPDITTRAIEAATAAALLTHPSEGRMANFFAALQIEDPSHVQVIRDVYFETMASQQAPLYPGTTDVLRLLKRQFRLALITNGPSQLQRSKIEHHGLDACFDWIVISEECGFEKPNSEIFEHTLGLAGIPAKRAAHAGDSLTADVVGANSAGVTSIWVRNARVRGNLNGLDIQPHFTIAQLDDLLS